MTVSLTLLRPGRVMVSLVGILLSFLRVMGQNEFSRS